jgi:predicted regulator of Ras-like GTPase activity (Roadblock/LC7/MglB family)
MVCAAGAGSLLILLDPSANLALLRLELKPFADRITQRLTL